MEWARGLKPNEPKAHIKRDKYFKTNLMHFIVEHVRNWINHCKRKVRTSWCQKTHWIDCWQPYGHELVFQCRDKTSTSIGRNQCHAFVVIVKKIRCCFAKLFASAPNAVRVAFRIGFAAFLNLKLASECQGETLNTNLHRSQQFFV